MEQRKKRVIVTTSWDDGHPLDLRIADLLARLGMRGTFYTPIEYSRCARMSAAQIRDLSHMGMEIGSHTVSHPRLTRLPDHAVLRELRESKDALEQMLDGQVLSFCFPEGKFSRRFAPHLRAAGYHLARTTMAFRTESDFDCYAMPVTFQLWPHSRQILLRHALKEGNLSGLTNWISRWRGETDLVQLADRVLDSIASTGGILHIWGHSWEIDQAGLWPLLEEVLQRIAQRPGVDYVTNLELLNGAPHSRANAAGAYA